MIDSFSIDIHKDLLSRLTSSGPDGGGDNRLVAARPDLAARALDGQVEAKRLVAGRPATIKMPHALLRALPDRAARQISEALMGETVTVFEQRGGWMWVQCAVDGYVGYLRASAISWKCDKPTHRVCAPLCHIYTEPDLKAPTVALLPMAARLTLTGAIKGNFSEISEHSWVPSVHILPIKERLADFAGTALTMTGAPYLWGGRTALGIDCSGLVQVAMALAGHAVARDSDMQERTIGNVIGASTGDPDMESWRRGDIVFFPDHVGIMIDEVRIIHANATHMMVSVEALVDVISRLRKQHDKPVTAVRRIQ